MPETLITRTFAEGLRPLGSASQRNHALVTHTLAARLSPAHALLFCEPSPTPDGVATDWYAQATGSVRRLDELEAAEGEAVRARLGGLTADILQLADAIEASDRNLAEALRHAVEVPTAGAIWVIGDQPVLVTWAHSREVDKAPLGIVRQFLPRRPPQSAAAAPAAAEVREPRTFRDVLWWCGWLLLAALLAWTFWLLVAPCALRLPGTSVLDLCPRSLAPAVRAEEDRRSALEDRVAMLERELALGGGCVALPPPPQQTAGLEPPPLLPPSQQAASLEPPADPDTLDAEKWEEEDIAVLEGCWGLASDYEVRDVTTGEISVVETWEMCFDANGRGEQVLVMSDGSECREDTRAAFLDDGRLRISDRDDVHCNDDSYIYRRVMDCERLPDGEAACHSRQPGRGGGQSYVRITNRVAP